jgi:glutamate N-acetyltransferase / amino-acid N-acetyltransferase
MSPALVEAARNIKDAVDKNKPFQVPGLLAAAACAEIKKGNTRPDLALIVSRIPCTAAGVFTRNVVKAAPILISMERIGIGKGQALLVNSGNANACTGQKGIEDARLLSKKLAQRLSVPESLIYVASTGVIGQRLPTARMVASLAGLVSALAPGNLPAVAEAIMTTDTFPKILAEEVPLGKKTARLVAMAKGAGMIHPNLATMLCFVLTDAAIHPALLDLLLREASERSFNRITIDGDTSTNDMVLALANGLAGNSLLTDSRAPEARTFSRSLNRLLERLAAMIVRDGEGATKFISIAIAGAPDQDAATLLAKTIATSPLVKTAFFGMDANWGRILAAMGRSGVLFDPQKVDVFFNEVQVVKQGISTGPAREDLAGRVLKKPAFRIRIHLHQGTAGITVKTCDLSLDYVRINAHYRT